MKRFISWSAYDLENRPFILRETIGGGPGEGQKEGTCGDSSSELVPSLNGNK